MITYIINGEARPALIVKEWMSEERVGVDPKSMREIVVFLSETDNPVCGNDGQLTLTPHIVEQISNG